MGCCRATFDIAGGGPLHVTSKAALSAVTSQFSEELTSRWYSPGSRPAGSVIIERPEFSKRYFCPHAVSS